MNHSLVIQVRSGVGVTEVREINIVFEVQTLKQECCWGISFIIKVCSFFFNGSKESDQGPNRASSPTTFRTRTR